MSFVFHVVIPCRYKASRLPGKPLLKIGSKTLVQHVYDAARSSRAASVSIATDDERIADVAHAFGAEVIMTSIQHRSGTDRVNEAVGKKNIAAETIVVNVQGDEFALPTALVDQVATALHENPASQMATLCERIIDVNQLRDANVVKVVRDHSGSALYFSRSHIPWRRDGVEGDVCLSYRHIGLYACSAGFLKLFSALPPCDLEHAEQLEQLRALYNGYRIHVAEACAPSGIEINTESDLETARKMIASH